MLVLHAFKPAYQQSINYMNKTNIILCGLPGSGKTTIGTLLSRELKYTFIDTDHLLERYYSLTRGDELSCREIVKKEGFPFFRRLECHLVKGFSQLNRCIISLGGGTLTSDSNVAILRSIGQLVYLKGDVNQFFVRITQKGIPLYLNAQDPKASFIQLATEREKIYSAACHLDINTINLTPHEVSAQLLSIL